MPKFIITAREITTDKKVDKDIIISEVVKIEGEQTEINLIGFEIYGLVSFTLDLDEAKFLGNLLIKLADERGLDIFND